MYESLLFQIFGRKEGEENPSADSSLTARTKRALHRRLHDPRFIALAIFLLALALRLPATRFGLPYMHYWDEPAYVKIALSMMQTGDFDHGWYMIPPFFLYQQMAVQTARYLSHAKEGAIDLQAPSIDVKQREVSNPGILRWGRRYTAILGALCCALLYAALREITRERIAILSGAILTLLPGHIEHSLFITADMPMAFMVLLTLWAALQHRHAAAAWGCAVMGIFSGMTFATKYNGLFVLAIPITHLIVYRQKDLGRWLALILGFFAGFTLAFPYWIIRFPDYISAFAKEVHHYNGLYESIGISHHYGMVFIEYLATSGMGILAFLLLIAGLLIFLRLPKFLHWMAESSGRLQREKEAQQGQTTTLGPAPPPGDVGAFGQTPRQTSPPHRTRLHKRREILNALSIHLFGSDGRRIGWVFFIFPILYTLWLLGQSSRFCRSLVPLFPWLAFFAALGLGGVAKITALSFPPENRKRMQNLVILLLLFLLFLPSAYQTYRMASAPETRVEMVDRIAWSVPTERVIGIPQDLHLLSSERRRMPQTLIELTSSDLQDQTLAGLDLILAGLQPGVMIELDQLYDDAERTGFHETLAQRAERVGDFVRSIDPLYIVQSPRIYPRRSSLGMFHEGRWLLDAYSVNPTLALLQAQASQDYTLHPPMENSYQVNQFNFEPPRLNQTLFGNPLAIGSLRYPYGLWAHGGTILTFPIPQNAKRFLVDIGVSSDAPEKSNASFQARIVLSTGQAYESEILNAESPIWRVDTGLEGSSEVQIHLFDTANDYNNDHVILGYCAFAY